MLLVLLSDTHGLHQEIPLPAGDTLIISGDITAYGEVSEVVDFNNWLGQLPFKNKIVIAGNHDFCFEQTAGSQLITNAIYLEDSAVTIDGIKFYGSPWQPRFCNMAFNLDRGAPLQQQWQMIPADTDVLITHGPPAGFGDTVYSGHSAGCEDLLVAIERIKPRLHVYGHIHEGRGIYENRHTTFINASASTLKYREVNQPFIFQI